MDEWTRRRIDKIAGQTLREAGIFSPPVEVEDLLVHLKVHREFYDLEDPALLQRFWHKIKVQKQKLIQVVKKIKLHAVWLPDEDRILVDESQPKPKQEWAAFHDGTHRILPWHRSFFLGDTAETLNPAYQEDLEEEANYGASALMFCGVTFSSDALDTRLDWSGLQLLRRRYGKSWVTTLRRFVEHGRDHALAMMVSTPWWQDKPNDQNTRCRHFVGSRLFVRQFPGIHSEALLALVDENTIKRRGGPVGDFEFVLKDTDGESHEFRAESFFNHHYILTLIVHQRRRSSSRIVLPRQR